MARITNFGWLAGLLVFVAVDTAAQPAAPHYDVVVLRVQFQPDESDFTTGNGTFEGPLFAEGLVPSVDPLPHDAAYFRAHLQFLEHYIQTVSDGRTRLTTHLLPEVVTVSGKMEDYSPTGLESNTDAELRKLANLIAEAWELASRTSSFNTDQLDPDRTVFYLIHAGVGRDVELIGTTLNKTPLDIPSIFFPGSTLQRLGIDLLTFKDVPIRSASVLPRTESRQGNNSLTDEAFLLNLSINGLMAATFLNHLGVPDLFDTRTGESAIGRFGVMDPAGIFAFSGLFPPEPSAWTRQQLGWVDVIVAEPGLVELPAAGLPDSQVLRVEVSDAEYFLVENRNRDTAGDGLVMQLWQQGTVIEQRVPELSDDFDGFNVDGFAGGVVIGVDDYDFSLPGRDADGRQFDGGILLWHVDERQFESGANNNDREHRALDLEEADSAQEIGDENYLGSPFDLYFEGNDTRVVLPSGTTIQLYENRFAYDTTPNSRTNRGGHSFVVLEQFSVPGPRMSLQYSREAGHGIEHSVVRQIEGAKIDHEGSVLMVGSTTYVYSGGSEQLYILAADGQFAVPAISKPIPTGDGFVVMQRRGTGFALVEYRSTTGEPLVIRSVPIPVTGGEFQPPLVMADGAYHALFSEPASAVVASVEQEVTMHRVDDIGEGFSLASGEGLWVVGQEGTRDLKSGKRWSYPRQDLDVLGAPVFGSDARGAWGLLPRRGGRYLLILRPDESATDFAVDHYLPPGQELSGSAVLADLNDDGKLEAIFTAGDWLLALEVHYYGALMDNYPVYVGAQTTAQPLVLETRQGKAVVLGASDGEVYAFQDAQPMEGFPIQVGDTVGGTPFGAPGRLAVVSGSGRFHEYSWTAVEKAIWGQRYATSSNGSYVSVEAGGGTAPGSLFVEGETYNWPNPIRHGKSYLRSMTSEDAHVTVRIVGADGTLAAAWEYATPAGIPVETLWTTDAGTGLYYARFRAVTNSGRTETRLVKMAIMR